MREQLQIRDDLESRIHEAQQKVNELAAAMHKADTAQVQPLIDIGKGDILGFREKVNNLALEYFGDRNELVGHYQKVPTLDWSKVEVRSHKNATSGEIEGSIQLSLDVCINISQPLAPTAERAALEREYKNAIDETIAWRRTRNAVNAMGLNKIIWDAINAIKKKESHQVAAEMDHTPLSV